MVDTHHYTFAQTHGLCNLHWGLRVTMMCQCSSIDCVKCTTLGCEMLTVGEAMHV